MEKVNRTTELGKKLFYASYILMLVRLLVTNSTLSVLIGADGLFFRYILRFAFWLPILFKLVTQDRFSDRTVISYGIFACAVVLVSFFHQGFGLVDVAILIVGAHGVPLKGAVRAFFYTASIVCGVLFFLSIVGVIENYVTYAGTTERYAFGNVYATDFAATLFYIELAHAYLKGKKYNFKNFIFWLAISFFILHFCSARLDFVLIFCTAWAMFFVAYVPKLFTFRAVKAALWLSIPALCILSILLHLLYTPQNGFLSWLNDLLSGRLYYGGMAIDDYGFSLFGQKIAMQGWGFTTEEWDAELGYYFVDCGWLSVALQYGVVTLLFLCTVFTVASRRALKRGDCVLPVILFFVALTSVVDHHVLEYNYDPFILVLNAGLCVETRRAQAAVAVPERT